MRISRLLMASTVIAGASLALIPAVQAAPTGPCPASINAACDLIITFNADGSVVTSGTGGSSIGGEDAVIGVVNNSGATVSSFAVNGQGSDIFGFDSDGIDFYTGIGPVAGNPDTTTYGGPNGYFTGITTDSAGNEIGNGQLRRWYRERFDRLLLTRRGHQYLGSADHHAAHALARSGTDEPGGAQRLPARPRHDVRTPSEPLAPIGP